MPANKQAEMSSNDTSSRHATENQSDRISASVLKPPYVLAFVRLQPTCRTYIECVRAQCSGGFISSLSSHERKLRQLDVMTCMSRRVRSHGYQRDPGHAYLVCHKTMSPTLQSICRMANNFVHACRACQDRYFLFCNVSESKTLQKSIPMRCCQDGKFVATCRK